MYRTQVISSPSISGPSYGQWDRKVPKRHSRSPPSELFDKKNRQWNNWTGSGFGSGSKSNEKRLDITDNPYGLTMRYKGKAKHGFDQTDTDVEPLTVYESSQAICLVMCSVLFGILFVFTLLTMPSVK